MFCFHPSRMTTNVFKLEETKLLPSTLRLKIRYLKSTIMAFSVRSLASANQTLAAIWLCHSHMKATGKFILICSSRFTKAHRTKDKAFLARSRKMLTMFPTFQSNRASHFQRSYAGEVPWEEGPSRQCIYIHLHKGPKGWRTRRSDRWWQRRQQWRRRRRRRHRREW